MTLPPVEKHARDAPCPSCGIACARSFDGKPADCDWCKHGVGRDHRFWHVQISGHGVARGGLPIPGRTAEHAARNYIGRHGVHIGLLGPKITLSWEARDTAADWAGEPERGRIRLVSDPGVAARYVLPESLAGSLDAFMVERHG